MMDTYKDYAFKWYDAILLEHMVSEDDFMKQWAYDVARDLNLKEADLDLCYDR